ncbi:hypothetical protein B0J13DRAFT_640602 [Dactylonectria estremocensis]|uniref:P-type ATPase A domain-containing protein n=1 Tax=Dactylonectria estremocensis TaxID=1079267 RepID=A0A9P9ECN3_9HYPO|nr:hypothetical protein B0J13DRAFT_640602 [Dactylonectria estremocensis]
MLNPKYFSAFHALGGLSGVAKGLQTDLQAGLSGDETKVQRSITLQDATGQNTPTYQLPAKAYKDPILILLTGAAVISLALGIYETVSSGRGVEWVESVAICVVILVVTLVGSLVDWQKKQAFVKLHAKMGDREIKVIRSGKSYMINVRDILVGDVLHLKPGDLVPVDGVSSSRTGCSVGTKSSFGKVMMSVRTKMYPTPLQKKLGGLAMAIPQLGLGSAPLLFFVLLFRFVAQLDGNGATLVKKGSQFMDILIVVTTVIVVAVSEGLPLAVTLTLAFATARLLKEKNLIRVPCACETMGNATTLCSDKTGTLTTNKMTVIAGSFGNANFSKSDFKRNGSIANFVSSISESTKKLIAEFVAINSTDFEGMEDGEATFIRSKTETAMLHMAKTHFGMQALPELRANEGNIQVMPFDSSKEGMVPLLDFTAARASGFSSREPRKFSSTAFR